MTTNKQPRDTNGRFATSNLLKPTKAPNLKRLTGPQAWKALLKWARKQPETEQAKAIRIIASYVPIIAIIATASIILELNGIKEEQMLNDLMESEESQILACLTNR